MVDGEEPTPLHAPPEEPAPPEMEQVEGNLGEIHILFDLNDQMAIQYENCKPWKLWAAAKMLEMLGDQVFVTGQMQRAQQAQQEAMARQALMEELQRGPGGLRGPRQ